MDNLKIKYTIVISSMNSGHCINDCLASVYKSFGSDERLQVIVKDALSEDNTVGIVKSWSDRLNLTIIEQKDDGIYQAWNQAKTMVAGEWFSFLGSDDLCSIDDKEYFFRCLDHKNEKILLFPITFKSESEQCFCENTIDFLPQDFLIRMRFAHPGVLHNTSYFCNDKFDEKLKIAGDYEFLLRYVLKNGFENIKSFSNSKPIVTFHDGGVSSLNSSTLNTIHEIKYIRKKWNLKLFDRFLFRLYLKYICSILFNKKGEVVYTKIVNAVLKIKCLNFRSL
ncbi:glycosyltransferase [Vibrio alfacsensis]|uniref:glycosyltransferase n=1 Tax=Vibrio alfacsensis TaxID=1074311 RepID=UPI004067BF63